MVEEPEGGQKQWGLNTRRKHSITDYVGQRRTSLEATRLSFSPGPPSLMYFPSCSRGFWGFIILEEGLLVYRPTCPAVGPRGLYPGLCRGSLNSADLSTLPAPMESPRKRRLSVGTMEKARELSFLLGSNFPLLSWVIVPSGICSLPGCLLPEAARFSVSISPQQERSFVDKYLVYSCELKSECWTSQQRSVWYWTSHP